MFTVDNPQLTRLLEMAGIPVQIQSSNVPTETGAPQMIAIGEF